MLAMLLRAPFASGAEPAKACATCHNPFHGFTDPARPSAGVTRQLGTRNSPTVINRLFSADQFWDGRAKDLEAQVAT